MRVLPQRPPPRGFIIPHLDFIVTVTQAEQARARPAAEAAAPELLLQTHTYYVSPAHSNGAHSNGGGRGPQARASISCAEAPTPAAVMATTPNIASRVCVCVRVCAVR